MGGVAEGGRVTQQGIDDFSRLLVSVQATLVAYHNRRLKSPIRKSFYKDGD
jgi:hypothetical protein